MGAQASVTMLTKQGRTVVIVRYKNRLIRCVRDHVPEGWVSTAMSSTWLAKSAVKSYRKDCDADGWATIQYKTPLTKDEVTLIHAGLVPATFDTVYTP